jgi:MFS family permease|tara:strand:- start:971 stop:2179 length:1209 start_codon:yes stop_codon:yes gene_type:complete
VSSFFLSPILKKLLFAKYPRQFWLLCLSTLLFFFSFTILIPELPDYITSLGGADYKGWTIGLFTIAAGLSRPISGKLADIIGRKPIMIFGGVVCIVMSFFYPLLSFVFGFLFLRFFHGLSTGFMPTGSVAYLADIIPANRRGEAMGLIGIMNNLGMMSGYAASSFIVNQVGLTNMFYLSGLIAFFSVFFVFTMQESLPNVQPLKLRHFKLNADDVWDSRAKEPAVLMLLTVTMFGAIITLIPDYSVGLGIENKGLFISIMTVSTIFIRLFTSKLSDNKGRVFSCKIGTSFWVVAAILLMFRQVELFYLAAIFCGMASGINSPALFAWAVDVANGVRSGRAMATLFIALEAGITLGAIGSASIYGNVFVNFTHVFLVIALVNIGALLYLFKGVEKKESKTLLV